MTEERYDATEQDVVLRVFGQMLADVTKDGGRKRNAGTKPPWWRDDAHEPAIFSHINKRMHGELKDPDSNAHPYVHGAWRMLAIAYRETYGSRDPRTVPEFAAILGQPADAPAGDEVHWEGGTEGAHYAGRGVCTPDCPTDRDDGFDRHQGEP